jgi:hypothetical protein
LICSLERYLKDALRAGKLLWFMGGDVAKKGMQRCQANIALDANPF